MQNEIGKVLACEKEIRRRVAELAAEIAEEYQGKPLTVIVIANGALFFGSDLLRLIPLKLQLDILAISSYIGTHSSDRITVRSQLKVDIRNRHVLVIDDIFDTGKTLQSVMDDLEEQDPVDIRTCVLLEKRFSGQIGRRPDYAGFAIGNEFVVGYGLDYDEHYRNLPYIAVLSEHMELRSCADPVS